MDSGIRTEKLCKMLLIVLVVFSLQEKCIRQEKKKPSSQTECDVF